MVAAEAEAETVAYFGHPHGEAGLCSASVMVDCIACSITKFDGDGVVACEEERKGEST